MADLSGAEKRKLEKLSFPYVAMMMKPGTDFTTPVRLPF